MFASALRPALRASTRVSRTYSSRATTSSTFIRNAVLAGSGLAAVSLALGQRQSLLLESKDKVPRESVLESKSLKEPLHKREGGDKKEKTEKKVDTPEIVEDKAAEAQEQKGPEGAFNEETGEINWDCPCLGGMADGPCGEDFKAAFSCFVYSEAEPKGMDCVEKFKAMQDCFRLHPEIYGEEIDDDEPQAQVGEGETATPSASTTGTNPKERDVPPPPSQTPPANNRAVGVDPENTPSKGYTKIKPSTH